MSWGVVHRTDEIMITGYSEYETQKRKRNCCFYDSFQPSTKRYKQCKEEDVNFKEFMKLCMQPVVHKGMVSKPDAAYEVYMVARSDIVINDEFLAYFDTKENAELYAIDIYTTYFHFDLSFEVDESELKKINSNEGKIEMVKKFGVHVAIDPLHYGS
jgi:hypothetical protein